MDKFFYSLILKDLKEILPPIGDRKVKKNLINSTMLERVLIQQ